MFAINYSVVSGPNAPAGDGEAGDDRNVAGGSLGGSIDPPRHRAR
jgi:hypothetical protein